MADIPASGCRPLAGADVQQRLFPVGKRGGRVEAGELRPNICFLPVLIGHQRLGWVERCRRTNGSEYPLLRLS